MKYFCPLAVFCLAFLCPHMFAQTHNWTGNGGDSSWFNSANWDAGTIPIETSSVSIVGNVEVIISSGAAEAYTIDLHNGALLELANNLETGSIITVHPGSTFTFTSGTLSGSGIHNNGLLKIEGNQSRTFDQTTINNNAQFLVTNSTITQVLGTTINNGATGVIDIASVGGFIQQSTSSVLNNEGWVKKSPDGLNPIGNFYLILEINNEGILEVQEDQIFLLLAGNSTFTNFQNGRVTGNGTYDITTTFVNEGKVLPGGSQLIGTLDITNNFSLNGGTIQLDIAGLQAQEFDFINVVGSPVMDGFFDINLLFEPQIGDEFTVINWNLSGSSCSFPQFTTAELDGLEYTFETFCNANDVTLRMVDVSVLGINDNLKNGVQFFFHPNPVSEQGTFVFSSEWISSEDTTLVIYNAMGQQVLSIDGFISESNTFHRGNLPGGIYFAQVTTQGKMIATTNIILN